jgi:putative flippase GtrA
MKKEKIIKKFLKYLSAGWFQFILDLFLLWIFTDFLGVYYLFSASISVVISSILGFTLNKKYVFKKSKRKFSQGYLIFLAITIGKIFAITSLLFFFVDFLQVNYILGRILTGLIIVGVMYTLHTKLTFGTDFD